MKVIDYIKANFSLDLIANMLVYPEKEMDMGASYEVWRAKDIQGNKLRIYEYSKQDAVKQTKEYLESEIPHITWMKEKEQ